MKSKFVYWLRWLAVVPGALLAGILATFPLHWFLNLIFAPGQEVDIGSVRFFVELFAHNISANDIEYLLYPLVIATIFVFAGYKIAPKYKFKSALLLFGIYVIGWSVSIFAVLFNGGTYGYEFSGRTILALAGAIIGLYGAKKSNEENHEN